VVRPDVEQTTHKGVGQPHSASEGWCIRLNDSQVNPHTGSLITVPVHLELTKYLKKYQIFHVGRGQEWNAIEGARVVIGRVDVP
jgi:hypothetical protein